MVHLVTAFIGPVAGAGAIRESQRQCVAGIITYGSCLFVKVEGGKLGLVDLGTDLLLFQSRGNFFAAQHTGVLAGYIAGLVSGKQIHLATVSHLVNVVHIVLFKHGIGAYIAAFALALTPVDKDGVKHLGKANVRRAGAAHRADLVRHRSVVGKEPQHTGLAAFHFALYDNVRGIDPPLGTGSLGVLYHQGHRAFAYRVLIVVALTGKGVHHGHRCLRGGFGSGIGHAGGWLLVFAAHHAKVNAQGHGNHNHNGHNGNNDFLLLIVLLHFFLRIFIVTKGLGRGRVGCLCPGLLRAGKYIGIYIFSAVCGGRVLRHSGGGRCFLCCLCGQSGILRQILRRRRGGVCVVKQRHIYGLRRLRLWGHILCVRVLAVPNFV